jgi:hypothetical protein
MIKNNTYYKGKVYLKFDKMPYYESGKNKLNKVHLDLRFTKLVSRIKKEGYNKELLQKIAKENDLTLKTRLYDFDSNVSEIIEFDPNKGLPIFLDKSGAIVNLDDQFMCYKSNMKMVAHGLAGVYKKEELVGYYGFSHRGGQTFKVGDIIFDADWQMSEFHKDFKKYKKLLNKSKYSSRIEEVIPYRERGSVVIETLEQAKEAAIKISDELS